MAKISGLEEQEQDFSDEQLDDMKKYKRRALPFTLGAVIFNVIVIPLVITGIIDLGKIGKTSAEDLFFVQSRIEYVLKFSTPGIVWLFLCIVYVIIYRVRSPAIDPLNNSESILTKPRNVLQNSFEQFFLSLISQLILVTNLTGEQALKFIPALNFLFILGRITFWLGYPERRSFGMMTNLIALVTTIVYIAIKFFDLYF